MHKTSFSTGVTLWARKPLQLPCQRWWSSCWSRFEDKGFRHSDNIFLWPIDAVYGNILSCFSSFLPAESSSSCPGTASSQREAVFDWREQTVTVDWSPKDRGSMVTSIRKWVMTCVHLRRILGTLGSRIAFSKDSRGLLPKAAEKSRVAWESLSLRYDPGLRNESVGW